MSSRIGRFLAFAGVFGGLAACNRRLERSSGRLVNRIGGETRYYRWKGGDLAYAVAGEGHPVLMVHGIYAGASSFEFRKNFEALAENFRVYALDLLGCGMSERPRKRYEPEDVTSQIEDFAREEIREPAHLIASSLSAALALPALVRSPDLFGKPVLICPTGYGSLDRPYGLPGEAVHGLFLTPVIGDSIYHAIVSRRGIRYYLEGMAYQDPSSVTEELVEAYYRTGHRRGAKYLPAAFVSGRLNLSAAGYWPRVSQRALICWGRQARTTPLATANLFMRNNPNATLRIFEGAALLPHDEQADGFNRAVRGFLAAREV